MLNKFLEKLGLCKTEELRKIERDAAECRESVLKGKIDDLKRQLKSHREHINSLMSKIEILNSTITEQDNLIAKLKQDFVYERNNHDCLKSFEVAEAKEYAECRKELKAYKEAEKNGLFIKIPCNLDYTAFLVSSTFVRNSDDKKYCNRFDDKTNWSIVEMIPKVIFRCCNDDKIYIAARFGDEATSFTLRIMCVDELENRVFKNFPDAYNYYINFTSSELTE